MTITHRCCRMRVLVKVIIIMNVAKNRRPDRNPLNPLLPNGNYSYRIIKISFSRKNFL